MNTGVVQMERLPRKSNRTTTMKDSISLLFTAAAMIAVIPQNLHAGTHLENRGRAGYTVVQDRDANRDLSLQDNRRETNVALVIEKPRQDRSVLVNMGRAGYRYDRSRDQGR